MWHKFSIKLIKYRILFILSVVLATGLMFNFAKDVRLSYSIVNLLPDNHQISVDFNHFKKKYGESLLRICWFWQTWAFLRDSGPKNPIFCSEWAFLRREKDDNMRSYICGHMHIFLSNQRFFVKKFSKFFMASPSSESADFGKPEPLWSRGFSVQMMNVQVKS